MKAICEATKRNGDPCTLQATGSDGLCWAHTPSRAAARKRTASRGGKGKAARKVAPLWDEVRSIITKVEDGTLPTSRANTMIRAYSLLVELARLEIEWGELEVQQRRLSLDEQERLELLPRLEELEDHAGAAS